MRLSLATSLAAMAVLDLAAAAPTSHTAVTTAVTMPNATDPHLPGDCIAEQTYFTGTIRWFRNSATSADHKVHVQRQAALTGLDAARKTPQPLSPTGMPISKVIDEVNEKTQHHARDVEEGGTEDKDSGLGAGVNVGRLRGGVTIGSDGVSVGGGRKWPLEKRRKKHELKYKKRPQNKPGGFDDGMVGKSSEAAAESAAEKAAEEAVEREQGRAQ